jgi:SAM-dependent methyltransferase
MIRLHGTDIYAGFVPTFAEDLQGWGSPHPVFEDIVLRLRPPIVIEVGVWKGATSIHLAQLLETHGVAGQVIAVDTFLGSLEHGNPASENFGLIPRRHGMPLLYDQFLANVVRTGMSHRIVPLPQTATTGALLLRHQGVQADLIHIDASHEYDDVLQDARIYWDILTPGGYMVGDDYHPYWPGVVRAADDFAKAKDVGLEDHAGKWVVRKPG